MEPPALSFVPNTQGSSVSPPTPTPAPCAAAPGPSWGLGLAGECRRGVAGQESQGLQVGGVGTCCVEGNWAQLGPPVSASGSPVGSWRNKTGEGWEEGGGRSVDA